MSGKDEAVVKEPLIEYLNASSVKVVTRPAAAGIRTTSFSNNNNIHWAVDVAKSGKISDILDFHSCAQYAGYGLDWSE